LAESSVSVLIIGVLGSLLLAVGGLLIGVGFAQFLVPTFPTVFIVPLALNIGIAYVLVRGKRADAGKVILFGGTFASVALPFILL
jgi:hypothetical protein